MRVRRLASAVIGTLVLLVGATARGGAQTLTMSPAGGGSAIPTLTESNYTSGTSASTLPANQITFTLACPSNANGGCTAKLSYSALQMDVRVLLSGVQRVGGNSNDICTAVGAASFTTVPAAGSPLSLVTATKGASCSGVLTFQVINVTYTTYQSPSTPTQALSLKATNP